MPVANASDIAQHVVCVPGSTVYRRRNEMVLFFGGSFSKPANSNLASFYTHAANTDGFHVISVSYPDSPTIATACSGRESACFLEVRNSRLSVGMARLRELMKELCSNRTSADGWAQYCAPGGELAWSKIVVAGHSQGSGMAVLLSKKHAVAGVVQLAGVVDTYDSRPAPWVTESGITTAGKLYGLGNVHGFACEAWRTNWAALNMSGWAEIDNDAPGRWQKAHKLCSHKPVKTKFEGHMIVVTDAKTYGLAWTYMLTRGLISTRGATQGHTLSHGTRVYIPRDTHPPPHSPAGTAGACACAPPVS